MSPSIKNGFRSQSLAAMSQRHGGSGPLRQVRPATCDIRQRRKRLANWLPETRDAKDKTHTRSTRRPAAVQFLREDQAHARSVRRPAAVQFVRYCSAGSMILFDCTLLNTQISSTSLLGLGPDKAYWCGSKHTSGREPIYGCNTTK